ncbi:MAG: hypothetical protein GX963_03405 [Bacteroidales bacterium]|nr:hypothetical protein [Bacteroidales bacterium]
MKNRISPTRIEELKANEIFVFGSNLSGHHGAGAARLAMNRWGAKWGKGVGLEGQTYGIPTMQGGVDTIKPYVDAFIDFAKKHQDKIFLVTEIGCGIAGFTPEEIAPLFKKAETVENIHLPERFWSVLNK